MNRKLMNSVFAGSLAVLLTAGISFACEQPGSEDSSSAYVNQTIPEEHRTLESFCDIFDPELREEARTVLTPVFKAQRRQIINNHKYGQAFPINPEFLKGLIEQAEGKRVLEIAGASGENAIALALAGAECVYMNDIVPEEVARFNEKVQGLPAVIQNRLKAIEGDCFKLTEQIEPHSLDVILARNIIHFLRPSQQKEFFQLVTTLLKPGGVFSMTANSRYANNLEVFDSDVMCFSRYLVVLDGVLTGTRAVASKMYTCDEDRNPLEYINNIVATCSAGSEGVGIDSDTLGDYPKEVQDMFMDVFSSGKVTAKDQRGGFQVRLLENTLMLFTPDQLEKTLEKHGFEVELKGDIGPDGYLASREQDEPIVFAGLTAVLKK